MATPSLPEDYATDRAAVKEAVDRIRAGAQGVPVEQLASLSEDAYERAAFFDSPEVWAFDGPAPHESDGWAR